MNHIPLAAVLLDLMMPVLDFWQVPSYGRRAPPRALMPVVVESDEVRRVVRRQPTGAGHIE